MSRWWLPCIDCQGSDSLRRLQQDLGSLEDEDYGEFWNSPVQGQDIYAKCCGWYLLCTNADSDLPQTTSPTQTPGIRINIILFSSSADPEYPFAPLDKRIHVPHRIFPALALLTDCVSFTPLFGRKLVEELFVDLNGPILHRADKGLLHAWIGQIIIEELAEYRNLLLDGATGRMDEFAALEVALVDKLCREGVSHLGCKAVDEVVDRRAEAAVELDLRVEHVLDHAWEEPVADEAHQIARVEETPTFAQFPKGTSYAREVELGLWRDIFDVKCDDLLFEKEEMAE